MPACAGSITFDEDSPAAAAPRCLSGRDDDLSVRPPVFISVRKYSSAELYATGNRPHETREFTRDRYHRLVPVELARAQFAKAAA